MAGREGEYIWQGGREGRESWSLFFRHPLAANSLGVEPGGGGVHLA